jgi:cellulose synthase/poly-beta-1,6-N-acetylglucosamine synthase-like glycosyltransferase
LPDALVVVDNNSTDTTAEIIKGLQAEYSFLHLVIEDQKGTGAACRTGFRYALDEIGAAVVARTDADTIPRPTWCGAILRYFERHPEKVSSAGIATYRKDEFYRPQYRMTAAGILAYRSLNSIRRRSWLPLLATHGHNMAVRGDAYDAVDGFAPTKIEEHDEDLELFKNLYETYGRSATGFNPRMVVSTSQRRRYMLKNAATTYYDNLEPGLAPDERARRRLEISGGDVDIR